MKLIIKNNNYKKAYTLIELMVVITIITFITIMTYAPYNYYSNKEKVRQTAKEISQTLLEARNMAINGMSSSNSNVQIGVYFDKNEKNKIKYLVYPHSFSGVYTIDEDEEKGIKIIKTRVLPEGMSLAKINDKENMLFVYKAISGDLELKTNEFGTFTSYSGTGIINFSFGFKEAQSGPLSRNLTYNTKTFISDY